MNATLTSNDTITAALASVGAQVEHEANSRWTLALHQGQFPRITVQNFGGWLVLEANAPTDGEAVKPRLESHWDSLAKTATLPGLAKFVLNGDGQLRLRADLLLHEDLNLTDLVRKTCTGFELAWSQPVNAELQATPFTPRPGGEPDLKQIMAETGWAFVERASGKLAVELEVAHGFYQALLMSVGDGVRVLCELGTCEVSTVEGRRAVAGLLLSTAGAVRLVRAVTVSSEPVPQARLEVVFDGTPNALELTQAFENLSVGCSLCGDEIKLLQDASVAQRYREIRGWI